MDNLLINATGCLLSGGKSTRMGTDKALLKLNGKPLIELGLEAFTGFPEILISAADEDTYVSYAFEGIRIIPDERPGTGPLGGIISTLKAAASPCVCFRPVDAPLVPAKLHQILISKINVNGFDAVVPMHKGAPEPLLACFSKTALPVLESLAAEGKYKAAEAFPLLDTYYIDLESPEFITRFGDPAAYLINANTPEAFSKLI